MLLRKVTLPAPTLTLHAVVRGAEICSRHHDGGATDAPPTVEERLLLSTPELEARAADLAAFEESLAEAHGSHVVTSFERVVVVAARAADGVAGVGGGVVGDVGG